MDQSDLLLGIQNLNNYGRGLCLVGLVVHAAFFHMSPYLLLFILSSYAVGIWGIYYFAYKHNFLCATRYERVDADCPSNSVSPKFESSIAKRTKELLPERRESLKHLGDESSEDVISPAEQEHKRRSAPRLTLNIDGEGLAIRLQDREGRLEMNHVRMSWGQFINCYFMIVPSAFLLQIIGFTRMTTRKCLHRHGLVQPKQVDYDVEVGKLCLESMQAIHFTGFRNADEETVAIFTWNEFPYVVDAEVESGEVDYVDLFVVDIDLTSQPKRMIKAMLDDRELTAQEVYILINYNIIAHAHPKIHALANWGLHTGNAHPFVRWNSCVTVMYNYFGMTTYTQLAACYKALGLLNYDYNVITSFFQSGCDEGIPPHENIRKLVKHSALVKFLVGTRNIFLNEFQDYREEFMGIDGEAMFAGTVLHGIDHTMYTTQIKDVLWVDHTHPEFGFMAECVQMVFEGFSKDLPLLPFNRRFSNATHPFYKAVYQGAHQLNPWFADRMDTCIIK